MPLFYRGDPEPSRYFNTNAKTSGGFAAHLTGGKHSPLQLVEHILGKTPTSPYISLSLSYSVAYHYAVSFSPIKPKRGYVYTVEIDLSTLKGARVRLYDPVIEIAKHVAGEPALKGYRPYQHDGAQNVLLGLADSATYGHYLLTFNLEPRSAAPYRLPQYSKCFQAFVHAMRDAEILALDLIPEEFIVGRELVDEGKLTTLPPPFIAPPAPPVVPP